MTKYDPNEFDVDNVLDAQGVCTMFGELDVTLSERVIRFILSHNYFPIKSRKHITLIINSEGGDLNSAFAIIDVIKHSAVPVHTLGLGQISSSGLMIFMAGAPGHRSLTPNTSIMSHQWSGVAEGKLHELMSIQEDFKLTTQRVMSHYQNCSQLTEVQIRETLLPAHDVFLTAVQAVQMGLADKIHGKI
jgi:ATP-dependent Clp protease protease subunit